jgi:hypothetical protein
LVDKGHVHATGFFHVLALHTVQKDGVLVTQCLRLLAGDDAGGVSVLTVMRWILYSWTDTFGLHKPIQFA